MSAGHGLGASARLLVLLRVSLRQCLEATCNVRTAMSGKATESCADGQLPSIGSSQDSALDHCGGFAHSSNLCAQTTAPRKFEGTLWGGPLPTCLLVLQATMGKSPARRATNYLAGEIPSSFQEMRLLCFCKCRFLTESHWFLWDGSTSTPSDSHTHSPLPLGNALGLPSRPAKMTPFSASFYWVLLVSLWFTSWNCRAE